MVFVTEIESVWLYSIWKCSR